MSVRIKILNVLDRWKFGDISDVDVMYMSESIIEDYRHKHPNGGDNIVEEVLYDLDILSSNGITRDDIPEIVAFLMASEGESESAWRRWREYWSKNEQARRTH
jgi:hypothetical protein